MSDTGTKATPETMAEQPPVAAPEGDFWKQQYDEAVAGTGGNFLFFKDSITRLRLIGVGDDPRNWCRQVESTYREQKSKKYLVLGYQLADGVEPELRAAVLTKGAWATVCSLQMEGYDLFTEAGNGVTVKREQSGGRISYNVMPSPRQHPILPEMLAAAKEVDWTVYTTAWEKMQESSPNNSSGTATGSVAESIVNAPANPNAW